jgi:hypothetical protein
MPTWKEGDRVCIVTRPATDEDRKKNRYFPHMAGLSGTVQNVYETNEVAIKIDVAGLSDISADVHRTAVARMREKFLNNISEEQKKQLTAEELNFNAHYMLLVQSSDLQKIG